MPNLEMRTDLTNSLMHFTKGSSIEEAYSNLISIVEAKLIISSNNKIKSGTQCVCFTETPLLHLTKGFTTQLNKNIYSDFGIMTKKEKVFQLGGRPVIYQPDEEYGLLNPLQQWRHVRYEPPIIDFCWEREWRIPNSFELDYTIDLIIVPDQAWKSRLEKDLIDIREWEVHQYSQIMEYSFADQYVQAIPSIVANKND